MVIFIRYKNLLNNISILNKFKFNSIKIKYKDRNSLYFSSYKHNLQKTYKVINLIDSYKSYKRYKNKIFKKYKRYFLKRNLFYNYNVYILINKVFRYITKTRLIYKKKKERRNIRYRLTLIFKNRVRKKRYKKYKRYRRYNINIGYKKIFNHYFYKFKSKLWLNAIERCRIYMQNRILTYLKIKLSELTILDYFDVYTLIYTPTNLYTKNLTISTKPGIVYTIGCRFFT